MDVEGVVVGDVVGVMLEESALPPPLLLVALLFVALDVPAALAAVDFATVFVVPPARTATPANAPVAAKAPAADQRVNRLTRRSALSRSWRFRTTLRGWFSFMPKLSSPALWPA